MPTTLANLRLENRIVLLACCGSLLLCLLIGRNWPLVGDSALMHYVVFLTGHGFAPYRDVAEMNLPFTYMSEQAAIAIFGAGSAGWRIYDGALILGTALLCWQLLRRYGAAPGVFAGALFATVHLQDGIHMAGQRDLLLTVFEAGCGLCLLRSLEDDTVHAGAVAEKKRSPHAAVLWSALAGALGSAAACIKPPAVLFLLCAAPWRILLARSSGTRLAILLGTAAGATVPLLASLLYLLHFGALRAFLESLNGLIAYHASIERRPLGFLLSHAWSPLPPLLIATLVSLALRRVHEIRAALRRSPLDQLCLIGVVTGLVSYLIQGKGFPYQRYPLLLWLLLWCASQTWAALSAESALSKDSALSAVDARRDWRRLVCDLQIATGLVLIAIFLVRSTHFSLADPYANLGSDLSFQLSASTRTHGPDRQNSAEGSVEGPAATSVQCLDTAGPCIGALLEQHIPQATGFLYDCYLLNGNEPVVQQQRAMFQREWARNPPEFLVLTESNCFTGPRTFDKYASWPWMQQQLTAYHLLVERHPAQPLHLWSRTEPAYAYRILRRK